MTEQVQYLKDYFQDHGIPWTGQTVIVMAVLLALAFLLVFFLLRFVWDLLVGNGKPKEETIESLLAPQNGSHGLFSGFDDAFDSLVQRTGLGISPQQGACWILAGAVAAAIAGYVPRQELWQAGPAFVAGAGVPLAVLIWHAARHRRQVQAQLPDAPLMLAHPPPGGQNP